MESTSTLANLLLAAVQAGSHPRGSQAAINATIAGPIPFNVTGYDTIVDTSIPDAASFSVRGHELDGGEAITWRVTVEREPRDGGALERALTALGNTPNARHDFDTLVELTNAQCRTLLADVLHTYIEGCNRGAFGIDIFRSVCVRLHTGGFFKEHAWGE